MKLKLFYSYCQKNDIEREELEKHLNTLVANNAIDEWYDGKIIAGENWKTKIDTNLKEANIVVFLITAEWLASDACKQEWEDAKMWADLQSDKVLIPVIARPCSWTDYSDMGSYQALPKAGKSVLQWEHKEEAWMNVYEGIKSVITALKKKSGLKPDFELELREIEFCSKGEGKIDIDDVFIFPNLKSYTNDAERISLESEVKTLSSLLDHSHQFVIGDTQSGKTTLAAWSYVNLVNSNIPAIYVDMDTVGNQKNKSKILRNLFEEQQLGDFDIWFGKEGKVILIDNADKDKKTADFIKYAEGNFEKIHIYINSDLHQSYYSDDEHYARYREVNIKPLCHVKQEELIKKWLELKGNGDEENYELIDSIERNINSIVINNNILPRFPFFILSILQTFEHFMPENLKITAYGHCYQALIVARLIKSGIHKEDIDSVFTFCTHLAFENHIVGNNKYLTQEQFEAFVDKYEREYLIKTAILNRLTDDGGIIRKVNGKYQFTISYTYYYFLGKFLAENYDEHTPIVEKMIDSSFAKHHSLTLIFTIHHANGSHIIDELKLHTMCSIDAKNPAKLTPEETQIFSKTLNHVITDDFVEKGDIAYERTIERESRNKREKDQLQDPCEGVPDSYLEGNSLIHQVLQCNKNIEILSQILKNKSGSLKKKDIKEIVETICEAGLRMASILLTEESEIEQAAKYVHELYIQSDDYDENSTSSLKITDIKNLFIMRVMIWVVNCLEKSVNAINKPEIEQIVTEVANANDTPAYKLIRYFYLLDTAKTFNKDLKDEFEQLLKTHPKKQFTFVRRLIQLRTLQFERTHKVKEQYRQAIFSALELKDRHLTLEQIEQQKSDSAIAT
ncbi:TIR domain-containing protein [Vibrio mediterranei]